MEYIDTRDKLPNEDGRYLGWFGWYDDNGGYRGFEELVFYHPDEDHWITKTRERPTHWCQLPLRPTAGLRDYRGESISEDKDNA